jgi:hypothetical protein
MLGQIAIERLGPRPNVPARCSKSRGSVWALKQVTDLDGNSIACCYTLDPLRSGNSGDGEYYISKFDYTGNAKAAVAAPQPARLRRVVRRNRHRRPSRMMVTSPF